jgi:hypothetical protein
VNSVVTGNSMADGLKEKLLAGGLSSMVASFLLNPCDVIKARMQMQHQMATADRPYKNFFQSFMKIIRDEGAVPGLMRGISAMMLRDAVYSSIRLGLYDPIKSMISNSAQSTSNPNSHNICLCYSNEWHVKSQPRVA